ncbi:MAG: IS1595 family transposase [Alphaproteobacteria bacterium]
MSDLQNPIFHDDNLAREWLENHLWPDGAVCPHCGVLDVTKVKSKKGSKTRPGLYQCNAKECRQQFTVTVGTVYERSKLPLSKWLFATYLLSASKKGMSTRQLSRMLGVSVKSAWFMTHRIREGMKPAPRTPALGGEGKTIEADETFVGGREKNRHKHKRGKHIGGPYGRQVVFTLIERGGRAHSTHVPSISAKNLRPVMVKMASRKSKLMTDEGGQYLHVGKEYASHDVVKHSADEYVRGDAHVNTTEGFFSILKRGITGVYHNVSEAHLQRYLVEFDFRYSHRKALGFNDMDATKAAVKGIQGRRLTYRRPDNTANA